MSTRQKENLGPATSMGMGEDAQGYASGDSGSSGGSFGGGKLEEKKDKDPDEVEGIPLPRYLQATSDFSADWCVDLFSQLCEAIQAFHDKEVFHLSLDTEKVRVFQMPKLADVEDLNIEKKADASAKDKKAGQSDAAAKDVSPKADASEHSKEAPAKPPITRYTPPELLRGEPPSVRSDIYILAAIFYEILTQQYFSKPLRFSPEDPRFAPYEWSGLQDALTEALEDDPLDRYETIEDFLDDIKKTRRDPEKPPPSALQEARKKVQEEMLDFVRKSVTKEALKKTMGWMRGAPTGGGGMGGMGGSVLGSDPTLANEIVQIVIKEIFGMMMKKASITAKGAIDRKLQIASAKRDAWAKRALRIAGKSLFLVGMVIGMLTGGGTKIFSWFRTPAIASQSQPGQHPIYRKKKKLPVTLRLWRYFFPPTHPNASRKVRPTLRTSSQQTPLRPASRTNTQTPTGRKTTPNPPSPPHLPSPALLPQPPIQRPPPR